MADEKEKMVEIPYFVHETDMERLERANKRNFILILVLIVALIGSNLAWTIYESQYEDVVTATQEIKQDSGDGGTNTYTGDFIGGDYYGETND